MSCDLPPKRSGSVGFVPFGPSKMYSLVTGTAGSARRSALISSRRRVSAFSFSRRLARAILAFSCREVSDYHTVERRTKRFVGVGDTYHSYEYEVEVDELTWVWGWEWGQREPYARCILCVHRGACDSGDLESFRDSRCPDVIVSLVIAYCTVPRRSRYRFMIHA